MLSPLRLNCPETHQDLIAVLCYRATEIQELSEKSPCKQPPLNFPQWSLL